MNSEWCIDVKNLGKIRISQLLIQKLSRYRQLGISLPESGGVLIGKHLNTGGAILVDELTHPQPSDQQKRYSYYRSKHHNVLVQQIWKESNHHSTYVGLWHTHAEDIPNYSSTDKKDWLNALNHSKYEGNHLIFIIVGRTHLSCWIGFKENHNRKIISVGNYQI